MKTSEIKILLWDIAKRYPRFAGLLKKQVGNETQGSIWASDLSRMNLDSGYLQDVCYDYASLNKNLPDPIDNIVKEIADEVRRRQYQDQRRMELHLQANRPKAGEIMATVARMGVGQASIDLGVMAKQKKITVEQNETMLNQLLDWEFRGKEQPDFITVSEDGRASLSMANVS